MTFDSIVLAALVGAASTVTISLIGIIASRRFGLPGVARDIESQQSVLIATLKGRIEALEVTVSELNACQDENEKLRRRVLRAEGDLIELYRRVGEKPPKHRKGDEG
jgi:hypothetical protein